LRRLVYSANGPREAPRSPDAEAGGRRAHELGQGPVLSQPRQQASITVDRVRTELGDAPAHAPDLVAQLLRSALDGAISWWHDHPEVSAAELGDITYAMLWHGMKPMMAPRR
jgi:hypothetical protein